MGQPGTPIMCCAAEAESCKGVSAEFVGEVMIVNINELMDEIKKGGLKEHRFTNVELKSDWDKNYGKKISALGNKPETQNAWLVIGVNDGGALCNKDEKWVKDTEEVISQQINTLLDPIQAITKISAGQINNNWVLILEIKNPGTVVYWEGVAYKASGTTIAEMQPEEITGLIVTLPGLNDYSKQPWTGKSNTNLAQSFVECIARNKKGLPFNGQSKIDDILNYANIL